MAIIRWEYGTWDSTMGYTCKQCGTIYPFWEGALKHEEAIGNNGDICPNVQEAIEDNFGEV